MYVQSEIKLLPSAAEHDLQCEFEIGMGQLSVCEHG